MANSLYPAFVRLFYETALGQHIMTIPTLAWSSAFGTAGKGGYINWADAEIDAVDMVEALATELADFQPPSTTFNNAIIYTMATETADPQPRASIPLAIDGVSVSADVPASQATMTMRTTLFGIVKLMWFDAAPSTDFLPLRTLPGSGQPLDLFNVFSSDDWAWAGRDGGQPDSFLQVSYTLNEALRRQYRLT